MPNPRIIFPVTMFIFAGCAFAFGGYQYWYARQVAAASDAQVAHIMDSIDDEVVSDRTKDDLYASIYDGYPADPVGISVDVSGSLAGQQLPDLCTSEGQREVCRSMKDGGSSVESYAAACGTCNPQ